MCLLRWGKGLLTLAGGDLPERGSMYLSQGSTYHGRGWGVFTLARVVPILARGTYLVGGVHTLARGVHTLAGGTYPGWGVPTLAGGIYPDWGVPTLAGGTYPGRGEGLDGRTTYLEQVMRREIGLLWLPAGLSCSILRQAAG